MNAAEGSREKGGEERAGRRWLVFSGALSLFLVVLWVFPKFWYTRRDSRVEPVWFAARTNIPGWRYHSLEVDKSAERLLRADAALAGEFVEEGGSRRVRVFSAKRYKENPNLIGLFVHTPDRCWTQAGWSLQPVFPDHVEIVVHGVRLVFERRLFVKAGHRELVYFGGLVGGQAVPYRLDHNLDVGIYVAMKRLHGNAGAGKRAFDKRFWGRVWDSFVSRSRLYGPKQFLRISTPAEGESLAEEDALLQGFLEKWLKPVPYEEELKTWRAHKRETAPAA